MPAFRMFFQPLKSLLSAISEVAISQNRGKSTVLPVPFLPEEKYHADSMGFDESHLRRPHFGFGPRDG